MYQDIFAEYEDFDGVLLAAVEALNDSEKSELLAFIDNTLRGKPSNQYLIDLWIKSGVSDILVSEHMPIVYEVILKTIDGSLQNK